jgi:hypothetical protein
MKITDYTMAAAASAEALRQEVLTKSAEGWEVYGGPLLLQKPVQFWQAMVKKFDPHAGEVWVQPPGLKGRWEKVV